jgi:flagellar basal-body rod modification protein FlgD
METQSIGSATGSTTAATEALSSDVLGKEAFLELLIAQLKNQDPLEPLDDQEFISQMTQFSSLEQLQNMNDTLSQNVQWDMLMSQTINNTMAASLIGREVTAGTPSFAIGEGETPPITFETDAFAVNGTITIYDAAGDKVRVIAVSNLQAGENSVSWNGKDDNGSDLADGTYTYEIDLYGTDGASVSADSYITGTVTAVKYIEGKAYLEIDGALVPLSDVRKIGDGEG